MTHTQTVSLVYAFDLRQRHTGAILGVGLVSPSYRYLSFVTEGAVAVTPELSAETWSAIDAWAAAGDAHLPARPAPMSAQVAGALIGGDGASTVSPERFAAIPLTIASRSELSSLASRLLPNLLRVRQSAS